MELSVRNGKRNIMKREVKGCWRCTNTLHPVTNGMDSERTDLNLVFSTDTHQYVQGMLRQIQPIPTHSAVFVCRLHSLKVLLQIAQKLCLLAVTRNHETICKLSVCETFCFGWSDFS